MVRNESRGSPSNNSPQQGRSNLNEVNNRKRNMTLDLNTAKSLNKRTKFDITKSSAPVLSSPDINMLKLASPELERMIIQNGMNYATPTPSTSQILFPTTVTEEQKNYVQGFTDALNELHGSDSSEGGSNALDISSNSSNNSMSYTDLLPTGSRHTSSYNSYNSASPTLGIIIKDEPQTVPSICSSPPLSPINMECQEIIKLERKRQRNRLAASKCRRRKLERIARLEDKVKLLKGENSELSSVVLRLKNEVCLLKEKVMEHASSGCQIMMATQYC